MKDSGGLCCDVAQVVQGGEGPAGLLMLSIIAASYAPIFNGAEPEKTFPSLKDGSAASYNFWSPGACVCV